MGLSSRPIKFPTKRAHERIQRRTLSFGATPPPQRSRSSAVPLPERRRRLAGAPTTPPSCGSRSSAAWWCSGSSAGSSSPTTKRRRSIAASRRSSSMSPKGPCFRFLSISASCCLALFLSVKRWIWTAVCRMEKEFGAKVYVGLRIPDAETGSRQSVDMVAVSRGYCSIGVLFSFS